METANSAVVTLADDLAGALGVTPAQAEAIQAIGGTIAQHTEQLLGAALGQPVHVGAATVQRMESSEVEQANWDLYHPVDLHWEIDGATHAPVLLLPKAELQALLPAAPGAADLPDMEALGRILRDLADQLSARLEGESPSPGRLALADTGNPPHDTNQPLLRVEQRVAVGQAGMQTDLTVIHLVPIAALQGIALHAPAAGGSGNAGGGETSNEVQTQGETPPTSGSAGAGGGVTEMENNMTSTQPATSVHGVQFQPFDGEGDAQSGTNLDLLLDVSLRVSVELGRTELAIKEILALGPGSVVELDKLAGEPVDILVNNRLIAKGEVVVVDENFGVRVTDIISPQKLVGKLR